MSQLLLIVGGLCLVILIFGILKRVILIALVVATLVALGALTLEYAQDDAAAKARDVTL